MMEDLLGGFDAGLGGGGEHVGDAQLALDLAVPELQRVLRHFCAGGMRPEDRGVAGGKNIDGVGRHGGHGMRDRQHHADDAPGRVLDDAQAGGIAAGLAAHGFHAKHKAHVGELENLVVEAADLGLLQLHAAQLFAAIVADADDDVDHALAIVEAHGRDLLLRLEGRVHGLVHGREHAIARGGGGVAGAAEEACGCNWMRRRATTSLAISATNCS